MEAALVSAATGALKPVLEKLAALLGDEYKRLKGVRGEIKFLADELEAMHSFLLKMSEEEDPDVQDKAWMKEVRELSYDMEDSIDDFMTRVDYKDTKPDGFMEKIKSSLGKMKARRGIAKAIEDLKKQIIVVGKRNARYKTREAFSNTISGAFSNTSINATVDPRALAIFEHASKLVGIDEPKAELIKLLTEEDGCASTQQQLKVVSIVGSGGMGKTTLANQVYQELKGQFESQAFVSVSRNPDMMNILRTIFSKVSNQRYADTEEGSVQQLIINITDFLEDKRYFIVVDDIWDVETWDVIRRAFPITSSGSRIIITTRINDVAKSCRSSFSGHIYNIRALNMVHSRQLFHRRLFNSENCPSYLEEVSDQILKKCAGLPLAIIAISGLLANRERTEDLWNQVKDSIGRALERNSSVEGMMRILSLSYFDLPHHLKTCLLYLSVFPEDYFIMKNDLIRRWIAEGFIDKDGRYTVHELGERCFNELVNRSLIQPGKPDRYDRVKSCRVHDTVLDFVISKSIEENFITLVGVPSLTIGAQSKVRRLSLQVGNQGNSILPTGLVLSHVRSLNVFGASMEIPSLYEFKHSRVLDFGGCHQLENHHLANIGRLFQLRHLNLRNTGVSELPEQIGHLRCLEMLDLRGTHVRELPAAIANLKKLAHVLIDKYVKFPDGIAKMQALEILEQVGAFQQSLNCLRGLGQLRNLRKLHLDFQYYYGDTKVKKDCMKAIASSLRTLVTHNLRSLTIVDDDSFLREPWCPAPLSLQILMTWQSLIPQVPTWVGSLVNLQQLRLEVDTVRQKDLCILGSLPALLILFLEATEESEDRLLRVSGEVGFRFLKRFCYYMPHHELDLMFAAGSMPKLENLEIHFRAFSVVEWDDFDFGIENLPCLITVKCRVNGHRRAAVFFAEAAMKRAASTHPNHPTLLFNFL